MPITRNVIALLFVVFSTCTAVQKSDLAKKNNTPPELGIFEKCIEDLGCFNTGPPFYHPIYRPIVLLPFNRFDTKFWLFDHRNSSNRNALEPNVESLRRSTFDPALETKIIIHGYVSTLKEGDYKYRIKDALLDSGQYNVLMVDWTDSNGPPYPQAVANARVVGAQLAQLIDFLEEEEGVTPDSIHLIGHSLGSHLAGWAGERVKNLGRITGLDPAGPFFQKAEAAVQLDPTDADFVDVIHTNGGTNFLDGLGILDPVGHQDFYPNGGMQQPGCPPSRINTSSNDTSSFNGSIPLGSSNSCNHGRAPELFISSIVNDGQCRFEAVDCDDRNSCRTKLQGSQRVLVAEMGFYASKIPGLGPGHKFYLSTTDRPPYCISRNLQEN